MDRRSFFILSAASSVGMATFSMPGFSQKIPAAELKADVVIIGGGVGGCSAALAALRNGRSVIMTEETDWIGGQLTQQAVPPDEHPWIETHGSNQSYRDFRTRIRDYYRRNYPMTEEARNNERLNPGDGWVSRICHEPRVSLAVLYELLAPFMSMGRLTILLRTVPVGAAVQGDRVSAVTVQCEETGTKHFLTAPYFIDATECGDLLPLTGTEYVTGFESQKETGERLAPAEAQPANMQAFTYCFAMDYLEGEDHTIDKPAMYDFWREFVPPLTPPWPGKLLAWPYSHPHTLKPNEAMRCDPPLESTGQYRGFWTYRRIANKANFLPGTYPSDICLVNWPHNDYLLGNPYENSPEENQKHLAQAKQLSLSLLYWMQTECPRADGKTGLPGLRLRKDIVGTADGLAKYPYIRESRRIRAEFTVCQQHVATEDRMKETGLSESEVKATPFPDSIGLGFYRLDLHPSTGGDNYVDLSSLPYQVPLGALIPRRMENLLPGCKNLGVTHLTNGCYRLHPTEWVIGEAVGTLAAFCLQTGEIPRGVRNQQTRLAEFQQHLQAQGVEIAWPT